MCPSSPLSEKRPYECDIQLDQSSTSLAIPIPDSHIHRTESELQLYENMAVAEHRDRCMFNRLVSGIRQRQQLHYNFQGHAVDLPQHPPTQEHQSRFSSRRLSNDAPPIQDTERSIENIISTRCNPIESDEGTLSNMTSDDSSCEESEFIGFTVNYSNANVDNTDNDWAIEGFESNPSSIHQREDEFNDINHHVFHMDL